MAFTDLPSNWSQRPVTDPAIFTDLVDLVVTVRDRSRGCLSVWICGPTGRLQQPIVIEAPPGGLDVSPNLAGLRQESGEDGDGFTTSDVRLAIDSVATTLTEHARPGSGLVIVIGRPGRADTTDADRHTHEVAIEVCRAHGIPLLGAAVATPERIWALPSAAAAEWAESA